MQVHLVNPSHVSFGVGVITPRWLFVIAGRDPAPVRRPGHHRRNARSRSISARITPGDVVGIGIHTGNALRGYEIGRAARQAGAIVVFGGIHATLYPDEAHELGGAHAVVKGDGDAVWGSGDRRLPRRARSSASTTADGSKPATFKPARWDLLPEGRYMWASVQTVRGCPKHCSFCSVWRTDGQRPRQRGADAVIEEIVELRRKGFRFIALADDNFYPVTLTDLHQASRRADPSRLEQLKAMRQERFELMAMLAKLPNDMVFFTQITMEASEDPDFLDAMRKAHIKGALVGIESVTADGLKDIYKGFNAVGDELVGRLQAFRRHGVHVLGSFIFGLPSDNPTTFDATATLAEQADLTFAQFVMLTPFPGTVDFAAWEKTIDPADQIAGVPITRHWLIPQESRPKVYTPHPVMSADEIRAADAGGLGSVLQPRADLEALAVRVVDEGAPGVRADLEALPPDVRQHRHRHRQRPRQSIGALGADDRQAVPPPVRGAADAGIAGAAATTTVAA